VLKADGGAAADNMLMQFQADLLGVTITRPKNLETTATGAALMAGLAIGYWKSLKEIEKCLEPDREFQPSWKTTQRTAAMAKWSRAIQAMELLAQ